MHLFIFYRMKSEKTSRNVRKINTLTVLNGNLSPPDAYPKIYGFLRYMGSFAESP
jgi:hypothetical protein